MTFQINFWFILQCTQWLQLQWRVFRGEHCRSWSIVGPTTIHLDPLMESASLASVAPPDVWYKLNLPDETINSRSLSSLFCGVHHVRLPVAWKYSTEWLSETKFINFVLFFGISFFWDYPPSPITSRQKKARNSVYGSDCFKRGVKDGSNRKNDFENYRERMWVICVQKQTRSCWAKEANRAASTETIPPRTAVNRVDFFRIRWIFQIVFAE
jgi:hypothetical protein